MQSASKKKYLPHRMYLYIQINAFILQISNGIRRDKASFFLPECFSVPKVETYIPLCGTYVPSHRTYIPAFGTENIPTKNSKHIRDNDKKRFQHGKHNNSDIRYIKHNHDYKFLGIWLCTLQFEKCSLMLLLRTDNVCCLFHLKLTVFFI